MRLIRWESEYGSDRVGDYSFFERPLHEPEIFQFKTRRMDVQPHGGAYSLKFTLSGREIYTFGPRRLALLPGEMLLVERGRTYGSEIAQATESLALFLPDAWIGETAASVRQDTKSLLDQPDASALPSIPAVPLRLSTSSIASLAKLVDRLEEGDAAGAEEWSVALVAEALSLASSASRLRGRLTEKRTSTRDELLTRLRRAHDRIVDQRGLGFDLDELSQTACLSRFHFLRLFKQVYGQSPLRFATSVRMQHAIRLAIHGDMDAALVAGGFRSKAAFRRAWQRASPSGGPKVFQDAGSGSVWPFVGGSNDTLCGSFSR